MKKFIKLRGKHNDLELGYVEDNTYYETGLLADTAHSWKILAWIDENLKEGYEVRVVTSVTGMMEQSQAANKASLDKWVKGASRNVSSRPGGGEG